MKFCMGCMREIEKNAETCPFCGYNEHKFQSKEYAIPVHSMLQNGKYEIGKVIGRGGFGIAYIARDTILNIPVAVKQYYPHGTETRDVSLEKTVAASVMADAEYIDKESYLEGKKRVLQEARNAAKIHTPGIVYIRDFFEENNSVFIVMDFVRGETLSQYIKNHILSSSEKIQLLAPIFDALKQIHAQGIIHRDISPDNIMINENGNAILLDFGAARSYDKSTQNMTQILKMGYTPIEQMLTKAKQGPWTDIYALGATLYKILSGERLDTSNDRQYNDETKDIRELVKDLSENEAFAIMKAIAVKGEDRWQTIDEFWKALTVDNRTAQSKKTVKTSKNINIDINNRVKSIIPNISKAKQLPWKKILVALAICFIGISLINTLVHKSKNNKNVEKIAASKQVSTDNKIENTQTIDSSKKDDTQTNKLQEQLKSEASTVQKSEPEVKNIEPETDLDATSIDSFEIENYEGGLAIRKYLGNETDVVIPSVIEGKKVVAIHTSAFYESLGLKSVIMKDGMKEIAYEAFRKCSNLESVEIPDSVEKIGEGAFEDCKSLQSINIPANVSYIGNNSFENDVSLSVVNINAGSSESKIGSRAFINCTKLINIEIPGNYTTIMYDAFNGCKSLCSVKWGNSDANYANKTIESTAFKDCISLEEISIGNNVSEIGYHAFEGCTAIQSIELPEGLTILGEAAFKDCKGLKAVGIPSSVEIIKEYCFRNDSKLEKVEFTEGKLDANIGALAFNGCSSITQIKIPKNYISIAHNVFEGCSSLQTFVWEESDAAYENQSIGSNTLSSCPSLTNVYISKNVGKIGENLFKGSPKVVVHTSGDSSIAKYAQSKGIPVVIE